MFDINYIVSAWLLMILMIPIAFLVVIIKWNKRQKEKAQLKSLEEERKAIMALVKPARKPKVKQRSVFLEKSDLYLVKPVKNTMVKRELAFFERPASYPINRIENYTADFLHPQPTRYEVYVPGDYIMETINGDLIVRAENCHFPNLTTITGNLSVDAKECRFDQLRKVEGNVIIHYPIVMDKLDKVGGNLKCIVDLEFNNELKIGGRIVTKKCKIISNGVPKQNSCKRISDYVKVIRTQSDIDALPIDGVFNIKVVSPAIVIPHTRIYGSVAVQCGEVLFPYLEFIGKDLLYFPNVEVDINISFPELKKINGILRVRNSYKPFKSIQAIGEIWDSLSYRFPNLLHLGKYNCDGFIYAPKLLSIGTLKCASRFSQARSHGNVNRRPIFPKLVSIRNLVCYKEAKKLNFVLKRIAGKKKNLSPGNYYFEVLRLEVYTLFLSQNRAVISNSNHWGAHFDLNSDVIPLEILVSVLKTRHLTFEAFKENELCRKWFGYEGEAFKKIIKKIRKLWNKAEPLDSALFRYKDRIDLHNFQAVYRADSDPDRK